MKVILKGISLTSLLLFFISSMSFAAIEAYDFKSIEKEETYKGLIQELRCLVCQNNNIADSNADLAKDLRVETYELVEKGKSRDEVVDYMVARYGDFVLYNPPVKASTYLLWFGPFILLVIILWVLFRHFKKPPAADVAQTSKMDKAKNVLSD